MKKPILFSLLLTSSVFAGERSIEIKTTADSCGEAGVISFNSCYEKAAEEGFRILDVQVSFQSEQKTNLGKCEVTSLCSYYQIID